jgi:hypothetical protein
VSCACGLATEGRFNAAAALLNTGDARRPPAAAADRDDTEDRTERGEDAPLLAPVPPLAPCGVDRPPADSFSSSSPSGVLDRAGAGAVVSADAVGATCVTETGATGAAGACVTGGAASASAACAGADVGVGADAGADTGAGAGA